MKNKIKVLLACSVLAATLATPVFRASGDANAAAVYLAGKSDSPWAVMALAANGNSPSVEHLKNVSGSEAIDIESPILALTAVGEDPRSFGNVDLVSALQGHVSGGQIGDPDILNDDIFGILALSSAGVAAGDSSISAPRQFLMDHQNSDGGWAFAVGGTSDTNTTAAAIMALLESGSFSADSAISNGFAYMKSAQNDDGGLPYDPNSQWGTDSDASSDAWAIMAMNKAGISPESWAASGGNPMSNLLSMQAGSGYFQFQSGSGEDAFSPVTTSYALIALSGKSFPVAKISAPANDADPEPSVDGVSFRIEGKSSLVCSGTNQAEDALEVVRLAADACGFTYEIEETAYGPYLKRIAQDSASGSNGWQYAVNGELASVGAADYELEEGDEVVWHYGGFDWDPASEPEYRQSLDLSLEIVSSTAPTPTDASISFSVDAGDSGKLDFGSMKAGAAVRKTITIKNQGEVDISVSAEVSGDSVFRDYLYIDGGGWDLYEIDLGANVSKDSEVSVSLPSNIQAGGIKRGSLIFWATAK
jgi:hypothetical protein